MKVLSFALLSIALVSCQKKEEAKQEPPAEKTTEKKSDAVEEKAPKEPKKAKPTKDDARDIKGVGVVPAWQHQKPSKAKCGGDKSKDAKLKAIAKGEDDGIADGSADVAALAKDLAADCMATRSHLADALNGGGFQHYKKKAYEKANRFWRAALVVSPAHTLARFNLACGLALDGKDEDALWMIEQLARAAKDGDASAINSLEKAKSDDDLKSIRSSPRFVTALESLPESGLIGPRKEPETSAAAVKLLPAEFHKVKDDKGLTESGVMIYKPALVSVWTWKPAADTELIVGTLISDPANLGQPMGDMNLNYGGLVVLRRNAGKLELVHARKTGESPPSVAAGSGNTVSYSFEPPCGSLRGSLSWKGKLVVKEMDCDELYQGDD